MALATIVIHTSYNWGNLAPKQSFIPVASSGISPLNPCKLLSHFYLLKWKTVSANLAIFFNFAASVKILPQSS